jgi:hypothetical protein
MFYLFNRSLFVEMYNIVNKNKDSTVPVFKLDILISFPVKTIRKDEKRYYMDMLQYSQDHLMLFPYHLSDIIVKGLRVTPFVYYFFLYWNGTMMMRYMRNHIGIVEMCSYFNAMYIQTEHRLGITFLTLCVWERG